MKRRTSTSRLVVALVLTLMFVSAAGCRSGEGANADPRQAAAAEATALLRQAEATAILARARATATALAVPAAAPAAASRAAPAGSPPPAADVTGPTASMLHGAATVDRPTPTAAALAARTATPPLTAGSSATPTVAAAGAVTDTVTVDAVVFGAEGVYLVVWYSAPPVIVHRWMPGMIYVQDEATGVAYNEIPVLPVIGPLFAKPVEAGEPAYVMLVNNPPLPPGSSVTVVLGDYKREHIVVH